MNLKEKRFLRKRVSREQSETTKLPETDIVKRFVSISFTRVLFLNTFNGKNMSRFPLYNYYYVSDMSLRNVDVKRPVRELEQMYFRLRLFCITYDPSDNVMKRSHTVDLHSTECTKL